VFPTLFPAAAFEPNDKMTSEYIAARS
jgi:hypothetical protein